MSDMSKCQSALRFGVGARVEVWISPDWKPGRHIEIISAHPPRWPPDGIWFPATVAAVHFQQQGWCPSFFCPYLVQIDGDVQNDANGESSGEPFGTPVREDDSKCIREPASAVPSLPELYAFREFDSFKEDRAAAPNCYTHDLNRPWLNQESVPWVKERFARKYSELFYDRSLLNTRSVIDGILASGLVQLQQKRQVQHGYWAAITAGFTSVEQFSALLQLMPSSVLVQIAKRIPAGSVAAFLNSCGSLHLLIGADKTLLSHVFTELISREPFPSVRTQLFTQLARQVGQMDPEKGPLYPNAQPQQPVPCDLCGTALPAFQLSLEDSHEYYNSEKIYDGGRSGRSLKPVYVRADSEACPNGCEDSPDYEGDNT